VTIRASDSSRCVRLHTGALGTRPAEVTHGCTWGKRDLPGLPPAGQVVLRHSGPCGEKLSSRSPPQTCDGPYLARSHAGSTAMRMFEVWPYA
jgi:hypothetical protein